MANGESLSNTNPEPRDDEALDNSAEISRDTKQDRGEITNDVVIEEKNLERASDNDSSTFEELRNVDISSLNHQQLLEYKAKLEEEHRRLSSSIAARRERLGLPPQEPSVEPTPPEPTSASSASTASASATSSSTTSSSRASSSAPSAASAPIAAAAVAAASPAAPTRSTEPSPAPTRSTEPSPARTTSGESASDASGASSERFRATSEKVKQPGGIKRIAGRIAKAAVPLILVGAMATGPFISKAGETIQVNNQNQDTPIEHVAGYEDQESEHQMFDYSEWSDFEHKNGHNNYGYDYTDLHGNDSETRNATIEMAGKSPQALSSYAYEYFTPQEKEALGIDNMTATEIEQAIKDVNNPNSVALHDKVLDKWQDIMNSGDTFLTFTEVNGTEYSYYMYGGDDNGDGSYTPDEVHLGYDQVERSNSKQFKIARFIDGKLITFDVSINEDCGFQPTRATAPQGVPLISTVDHESSTPTPTPVPDPTPDPDTTGAEDTGSEDTGSEDTGLEDTGSEDTGEEDTGLEDTGSEDTGEEDTGLEDTGEEDTGSEDTGEESTGSEDTGEEGTGSEDTGSEGTGSEDTGSEGTGSEDTGSEGTGSEDTGSEDTGEEGTGSEDTDWGKSGDPHGGEDVTPSDLVDPGSEVSQDVNDSTNEGNQGYVDDNQATPGSASEANGVDDSGFAEVIADGADTDDGRLSGGEEQGGDTMNGDNAYQDQETIEQGQAVDDGGNAAQEEAQTSGGEDGTGAAPGGDNNSDAAEEAAVEKGDF